MCRKCCSVAITQKSRHGDGGRPCGAPKNGAPTCSGAGRQKINSSIQVLLACVRLVRVVLAQPERGCQIYPFSQREPGKNIRLRGDANRSPILTETRQVQNDNGCVTSQIRNAFQSCQLSQLDSESLCTPGEPASAPRRTASTSPPNLTARESSTCHLRLSTSRGEAEFPCTRRLLVGPDQIYT